MQFCQQVEFFIRQFREIREFVFVRTLNSMLDVPPLGI